MDSKDADFEDEFNAGINFNFDISGGGKKTDEVDEADSSSSADRDLTLKMTNISFDCVAAKLLSENCLLTALELHTELLENGRELPRLTNFFSNPGNFEKTSFAKDVNLLTTGSGLLPRTSSCQTFDSLDFARYSDDGERVTDDKVAVLEFELRKAQETIKSLREQLTRVAGSENASSSPKPPSNQQSKNDPDEEPPIKEHECRAINFLINEFLLQTNNKLTSVTFAEENENQDFDDWDDVGLNIPKPLDLLTLYRTYGFHVTQNDAKWDC
ncbi:RAB11-binding protein RELCH-like [Tubulanus polymorphus]|uniref:RAB11-binding protein RELCH-like n=1 Tax=Tubulanus polymorphus TaxID=672921 RepID=UPI003DA2AA8D